MNTGDEPISGQLAQSDASFIDDFQFKGIRLKRLIRGAGAIVNESIKCFLTRITDGVDVIEMCERSNESADELLCVIGRHKK
jgi:hypothetical protein